LLRVDRGISTAAYNRWCVREPRFSTIIAHKPVASVRHCELEDRKQTEQAPPAGPSQVSLFGESSATVEGRPKMIEAPRWTLCERLTERKAKYWRWVCTYRGHSIQVLRGRVFLRLWHGLAKLLPPSPEERRRRSTSPSLVRIGQDARKGTASGRLMVMMFSTSLAAVEVVALRRSAGP